MSEYPRPRLVELTDAELAILNNALNEVCNNFHADEAEFQTHVGGTRQEARALLTRLSTLIGERPA